jgi:hypothetical protein
VVYSIWSTVSYMGTSAATSAQPDGPDLDLSQRALRFLSYASIGPYLLPLAMILLCSSFVLIHWPPRGRAGTLSWNTPRVDLLSCRPSSWHSRYALQWQPWAMQGQPSWD